MCKPIKIIVDKAGWDTKIYEDGEDLTKKVDGIFGIDIKIRVDSIPKIIIYRYAERIDFEGKKCKVKIKNHKPKKIKGGDNILDVTDMSHKSYRHYIANEK